jgi:hypothetical protein
MRYSNEDGGNLMSEDILTCIDTLDDDQAISQIRCLLQAAMRGTPAFAAMGAGAIADRLNMIAVEPQTLAEAASIVRRTPTKPVLTRNVGAAARELLLIFAQTPGGERILYETLNKQQEESPYLGFVTAQTVFTFLWLAVAGDLDLKPGWYRYRKKALTAEQQARLLKPVLPIAVTGVIESLAVPILERWPEVRRSTSSGHLRVDPAALDSLRRPGARAYGAAPYA